MHRFYSFALALTLTLNAVNVAQADSATIATPRSDANSQQAHLELVAKAKQGGIDLYFVGDSITRRWGTSDAAYREMLANWKENFHGWNAGDFGWGADRVENILWRLENGELDGVNPKVIVILAGTNNVGKESSDDAKADDIVSGLKAVLRICQAKAPAAKIILTAIFPRNDNPAVMPTIDRINAQLAKLGNGKTVRFLNVNDRLADQHGTLHPGMMVDGLHPTVKGYQVWADGLKPILAEWLGPRSSIDHAPPPSSDPSARKSSTEAKTPSH